MDHEFVDWLGTPGGLICAILLALNVVWFFNWRTSFRKWEGDFGLKLQDLGFPTWFVEPFFAASQGNKLGAIGKAENAVKMVETAGGKAEILKGILLKAKADPNRWAIVKQVIADVEGGIDPTSDIQAGIVAGPWGALTLPPTPMSVLKNDIQTAVSHVQALSSGDPVLGQIANALQASGLSHLLPLVAAGKAIPAPVADSPAVAPATK